MIGKIDPNMRHFFHLPKSDKNETGIDGSEVSVVSEYMKFSNKIIPRRISDGGVWLLTYLPADYSDCAFFFSGRAKTSFAFIYGVRKAISVFSRLTIIVHPAPILKISAILNPT